MLNSFYTKQFEKDVHLQKRRCKNMTQLKEVMATLIEERGLPRKHRDHKLMGEFKDYRECHIESDWLLIYRIRGSEIDFVRTGTHADLFE